MSIHESEKSTFFRISSMLIFPYDLRPYTNIADLFENIGKPKFKEASFKFAFKSPSSLFALPSRIFIYILTHILILQNLIRRNKHFLIITIKKQAKGHLISLLNLLNQYFIWLIVRHLISSIFICSVNIFKFCRFGNELPHRIAYK